MMDVWLENLMTARNSRDVKKAFIDLDISSGVEHPEPADTNLFYNGSTILIMEGAA